MAENILSLAAMERIMKKAGINRASDKAKIILSEALERKGIEIADKAMKLAIHSRRKTVMEKDIRLALS